LFLDRDGTLIYDRHYLAEPAHVELLPGVAAALRRFRRAGYALVVVSNQSGIARGYFDVAAYHRVERRLDERLAAEGVTLDASYFCPHHPDFTGPCACRKPGVLLFREAAETLGIDLGRSVFAGDRWSDVEPGVLLGGTAILLDSGPVAGVTAELPVGVTAARDLGHAALIVLGPETEG
jgi:D-glycero-D-manno-heptose 1,7-bisphosphate phosphatase